MRVAYADPPYPGLDHFYRNHPDYAGEVDHAELIQRMERDYDGGLLHTSSVALREVLPLCPESARVMAWTKGFAAFKKNVYPAYAWEPVIVKACRKPEGLRWDHGGMRDWINEPMTLKRGLVGAKPEAVCFWGFDVLGMEQEDDLDDLFPRFWGGHKGLGSVAGTVENGAMTTVRYPTAEDCPDAKHHTVSPRSYLEWHEWAERMAKTHRCTRCESCGFWAVWGPKAKP